MDINTIVFSINKYGFPVVAVCGIGYILYYIWNWVTTEIKPVISETTSTLVDLIDRIRLLENDQIRLEQKVNTAVEMRSKLKNGKKYE